MRSFEEEEKYTYVSKKYKEKEFEYNEYKKNFLDSFEKHF